MTTSSSVSLLGRRAVLALGLTVLLSACGFHLRGSNGSFMLPFATMYIGLPDTSPLAIDLKRYIRAIGSTEVVNTRDGADAVLDVLSDPERNRTKTILSLNSSGRRAGRACSATAASPIPMAVRALCPPRRVRRTTCPTRIFRWS